jgi:hypothetical protein
MLDLEQARVDLERTKMQLRDAEGALKALQLAVSNAMRALSVEREHPAAVVGRLAVALAERRSCAGCLHLEPVSLVCLLIPGRGKFNRCEHYEGYE